MISEPGRIRAAYEGEDVASRYAEARFREPIGALLHARQARVLRALVKRHNPRHVLEIAPGPARLTVAVASVLGGRGAAVDASAAMLAAARPRLAGAGGRPWLLLQGDAFQLPLRSTFDLVYAFRLIRHFQPADRSKLYREVARVLKPTGLFVFDAVNERVSGPLRARAAPGEYPIYDALFRPEQLAEELRRDGFDVIDLTGAQRNYRWLSHLQVLAAPRSRPLARLAMEIIDRLGGEPLEWVVTCRRL